MPNDKSLELFQSCYIKGHLHYTKGVRILIETLSLDTLCLLCNSYWCYCVCVIYFSSELSRSDGVSKYLFVYEFSYYKFHPQPQPLWRVLRDWVSGPCLLREHNTNHNCARNIERVASPPNGFKEFLSPRQARWGGVHGATTEVKHTPTSSMLT